MSMNPIAYTEKVVSDFLKYQITTFPFADHRLHSQLRALLSLDQSRETPLMMGPYVSLSRSFRMGVPVDQLIKEGVLHPHLKTLIPFPAVYGHQEEAIRSIDSGKCTLVSTGTGSGKTECFLYPIISRCLKLRDEGAKPGIVAVLVYPMNALAEDQLGRLRELLAGTGITFGMYVGKTPENRAGVTGERLKTGSTRADYMAALARSKKDEVRTAVHPAEERCSREEMREVGGAPRILLTNVKQIELLLTRHKDVELFHDARLDFLVFDEAHTFSGANGAETACLIRRLRSYCERDANETVCVGTSATIADPRGGTEAGKDFAYRFFGVERETVTVVSESYADDLWASPRADHVIPAGSTDALLRRTLKAVDDPNGSDSLRGLVKELLGAELGAGAVEEALYDLLSRSLVCFKLANALKRPLRVATLVDEMTEALSRPVSESELLIWLALGAAARKDGRPLLRPVVHAFVRGIGGAVVSFPEEAVGPKLHLSAEQSTPDGDGLVRLPVITCSSCGQHAFVHFVEDVKVEPGGLGGGQAIGDEEFWDAQEIANGGQRIVLMDRLVQGTDHSDDHAPARSIPAALCRYCGALHASQRSNCLGCGQRGPMVVLNVLPWSKENPGFMTSCPGCHTPGRPWGATYREPARPVRAVAVSDVHVLAQNMIQHAERPRLLVFADNRQEAAFQAGWMKDHARRFRLRSLMDEVLRASNKSVGDLSDRLDQKLDADDSLSRALVPEVWSFNRKEAAGSRHREERRRFLRILVLRELTTGIKQRIGLEPWGRLKVEYFGLVATLPFFQRWAGILSTDPATLCEGVASILDLERRRMLLLDREGKLFSRLWMDGDLEIQRGYIPKFPGVPKGIKFTRGADDDDNRVEQWLSASNRSSVQKILRSWGVKPDQLRGFAEELWQLLAEDLKLLVPVTLVGAKGNPLQRCSGVRQIDADRLILTAHSGRWRCQSCRRTQVRTMPGNTCMAYNCSGSMVYEAEDPEDYNLSALGNSYAMVKPEEHSAQVPADQRDRMERQFKGDDDAVNTLVCTPTLEMGIDIGSLDAVMMRNVPPLPSNYWQRAGRAGRRHRLAVALTYARSVSHDLAYYRDPLKLLEGKIEPPKFNLRNDLMVRKHVHAATLTRLQMLARTSSGLPESTRDEIATTLTEMFPTLVRGYLFTEDDRLRMEVFDLSPLKRLIESHGQAILEYVRRCFAECWPQEDSATVAISQLEEYVAEMPQSLEKALDVLRRRRDWCMSQIKRLGVERADKGSLSPSDESLLRRCDRLIKQLKGVLKRKAGDAEGYDDSVTFGVLASEGFLPGYGLDTGTIRGTALMSRLIAQGDDFPLPRPKAMALREYVPGNLIYANGNRFIARHYHLEPEATQLMCTVDPIAQAVSTIDDLSVLSSLGEDRLLAVPICDVELPHYSNISDEEDFRFQMPVAVYGMRTGQHGAGVAYHWGARALDFLTNLGLRLVNVGPTNRVSQGDFGYPICRVCGDSRSPVSSQIEIQSFLDLHQERCGRNVGPTGFYADISADSLTIPDCSSRKEAWSLLECLRIGMSRVLEMEREDLLTLVIGQAGLEQVDAVLYDPMPGGSGLLQQAFERWGEVVEAAMEVAGDCPSQCQQSCPDCLQNFRNSFYHVHLDRMVATECMTQYGEALKETHAIVAKAGVVQEEWTPVNVAEALLKKLLEKANLPTGVCHKRIEIGHPYQFTEPDIFWEDPDGDDEGLVVYLDGLSARLHGNPSTRDRDLAIRQTLRNKGFEVIEIPASQLHDRNAMVRHIAKIAKFLVGKEKSSALRADTSWFSEPETSADETKVGVHRKSGFDSALYPKSWQALLARIAEIGGYQVEPGGEVAVDERVVGSYIAEVSGVTGAILIVDASDEYANSCEAAINSSGKKAMRLNPANPDSFSVILSSIGGA